MKIRWRGQSLVEFALILPVLLLVLLGIIEAALVVQGYVTVQHAAREAARFAVTYQPVQGACLDQDGDGQIEDGISHDPDDRAPYPACPVDNWGQPNESDQHYFDRRALLIKERARVAATGLRINDSILGNTWTGFFDHKDEPRFFGVLLWGYPSFLVDCNDPGQEPQCRDHPGLEGLPVRVLVRHNVQIVDPLYRVIASYVPVQAEAQMINEGVQVGFGDVPPPDFDTKPDLGETPIPTNTGEPSPTDEPTGEPHTYLIRLDPHEATNTMPDDREHEFVATVTDELSRRVESARVSFSTDVGGFSYSGVEPRYLEQLTDADGQSAVFLYGNDVVTATLRAWLDYDGDDAWDAGEPYDTATKSWIFAPGPYITVSSHEVNPLEYIYINLKDHAVGEPYRLSWCVISGTQTSTVVQYPVNVDAEGEDSVGFEIPVGSQGEYRVETHTGSGGCGDTPYAYSADIRVRAIPPDLHITDISWPPEYGDELPSGTPIMFTMVVSNASPTPVQDTYFDADYYVDPDSPPPFQGQMGTEKQWLLNIGPYGEQEVHAIFELGGGQHQMWGQVDTTNFVDDESDEENNISGPYTVTVRCTVDSTPYGDDFNDGVIDDKWTGSQIGSTDVRDSVVESGGYLQITASGSSIWSSSDNFFFFHQSISGDFDARLRVIDPPNYSYSSKMGLMVRNSLDADSRHVMFMVRESSSRLQVAYRAEDGGGTTQAAGYRYSSLPVWVRIVRNGNMFDYYYSTDADPGESDWTFYTSASVEMGESVHVGIAHASYNSYRARRSLADEFVICQPSTEVGILRPPGLRECEQLLEVGGFEGNPDRVFSEWNAGDSLAFQHQSTYFYEGTMSMRLHAALGSYPVCPVLNPWLYQTVEIPEEVYTMTTLHVRGQRLVAESGSRCCNPNTDPDDVLYLQMKDGTGTDLGGPSTLATGGATPGVWEEFEQEVTSDVDPYSRAAQDVQVYFYGVQDATDYDCTFFYLDDLECEACTEWPVPEDEPGMASIGGGVRVLVSGIPQKLQGVDVWAYSPGGEVYHTVTIQDSTYHFYNIPPGTYTVYSEIWIGGGLRFATTMIVVGANERNYGVDLFLL